MDSTAFAIDFLQLLKSGSHGAPALLLSHVTLVSHIMTQTSHLSTLLFLKIVFYLVLTLMQ